MKKRLLLIAAIVCALLLGTAAVTLASSTVPTVVFDATSKTFTFKNCKSYTYGDGSVYPDLFSELKNVMPGDSFTQKIKISVVNNSSGATVKMYLRVENANADYNKLLAQMGNKVTFSASYTMDGKNASALKHTTNPAVSVLSQSPINDSVYLGGFTSTSEEREISLGLSVSDSAGNELSNLNATADWVFTAEVIPKTNPSPGPGSGSGSGSGSSKNDEEEEEEEVETGPLGLPILDQTIPRNENRVWATELREDHTAFIVGYFEVDQTTNDETGEGEWYVHPERNMTRAEVSTVVFRMLTDELRKEGWSKENAYIDVSSDVWFNNPVSTLEKLNIVNGYEDGTFRGDDYITRAELVTLISKIVIAIEPRECSFPDIEDHWACEAIKNAYSIGLIQGYPDGDFKPNGLLTRAEAITIFNRLLGREPEKESIIEEGMLTFADNMDESAWYYLDIQEATNSHEHGYRDVDYQGNREYWVELQTNVEWEEYEDEDSDTSAYAEAMEANK